MGKIIYLMGKSSSGKDTIFKELLKRNVGNFKKIVPYTTRDIRVGEVEGLEYHFVNEAGYLELREKNLVIEAREYHTYLGLWRYFTVDDGSIDLQKNNYIVIGTIQSYLSMCDYFESTNIIPILIELDDGVRLQRALQREMAQENPKYEEMCRRFLADSEDFSLDNLKKANINFSFSNGELALVIEEIEAYIKEQID